MVKKTRIQREKERSSRKKQQLFVVLQDALYAETIKDIKVKSSNTEQSCEYTFYYNMILQMGCLSVRKKFFFFFLIPLAAIVITTGFVTSKTH